MSHSCFYDKGCQTGPPAYSPYPRRLESITICWCNYKGSTFYSVISRPWVLNESNSRPPWQLHAQPTEPSVRGYGFFRSKQTLLCCISPLIDCWTHFTNLRLSLVYQSATFNFIVFFFWHKRCYRNCYWYFYLHTVATNLAHLSEILWCSFRMAEAASPSLHKTNNTINATKSQD